MLFWNYLGQNPSATLFFRSVVLMNSN